MTLENFWQLLAGLGIFLFGMFQLEDSLKRLAGRTFKLFLRKHTNNKFSAILSGTITTAVLQSSSVVTLMVLGFVGAGIISMRNALGVVFGANLGTTLSNWVVAALGFKFNIESFALPIVGVAGVALIAFSAKKNIYHAFRFFMGFGLLFLGLAYMKESIGTFVHGFDFAAYEDQHRLSFVLIGFLVTAIIQSSSATMVITLSALDTGAISFETAVAVVIGSELGASLKALLGSIGGIAEKKRVGLGNIIFNVVITVIAYLFMFPFIAFIKDIIGINDPLIRLVMFQSVINLVGIVLFFPFLKHFSDFLEKRFSKKDDSATYFIQQSGPLIPEAALATLERETLLFIRRVIQLNMEAFQITNIPPNIENRQKDILKSEAERFGSYLERYDQVKRAEGEILSLYTRLNDERMEREEFIRLNQLISAVRNAMYSAKGLKDIRRNRHELRDSADDVKYEQYKFLQSQLDDFYAKLNALLCIEEKSSCFDELVKLMGQIRKDYDARMKNVYKQSSEQILDELDISTLLNINREVYSSCKAIIHSLKDYLLDEALVESFENTRFRIGNNDQN